MELIKLVANYLQEELEIPCWPNDPRFYVLNGKGISYEWSDRATIMVYNRDLDYHFKITATDVDNKIYVVERSDNLISSRTIDIRDPKSLERLREIINNPCQK